MPLPGDSRAERQDYRLVVCPQLALAGIRVQKRNIGNSVMNKRYFSIRNLIDVAKKIGSMLAHDDQAGREFR